MSMLIEDVPEQQQLEKCISVYDQFSVCQSGMMTLTHIAKCQWHRDVWCDIVWCGVVWYSARRVLGGVEEVT